MFKKGDRVHWVAPECWGTVEGDSYDDTTRVKWCDGYVSTPANKYLTLVESDLVSPSYYTEGRKYEPRLVVEDWDLNFYLGSALKYISRAGRKGDAIPDLKKAIHHLTFEIERLEGNG